MPKGTRVHKCVDKLKKKKPLSSAIPICQHSTGQSYATGRTKTKAGKSVGESLSRRLDAALFSTGNDLGSEPGDLSLEDLPGI